MEEKRTYFVIDARSFYASVEAVSLGLDPMRTKLVVADASRTDKTICLAVSPALKKMGVRNRCRLYEVPKDPDIVIAKPRMRKYISVSASIYGVYLRHISKDDMHVYSIDEAFLDVTVNKLGIALGVEVARRIKADIRRELDLVASAGVSYNKFLAKIASDWRKPDGLCTVHPDRALDFIAGLKIERFWGVGEKTAARMHALGIHTGAELRAKPLSLLTAHFGKMEIGRASCRERV